MQFLLPLGGHAHLAEPGCLCTAGTIGACASKLLENGVGTWRRTSYLPIASDVGTWSPTWTTAQELHFKITTVKLLYHKNLIAPQKSNFAWACTSLKDYNEESLQSTSAIAGVSSMWILKNIVTELHCEVHGVAACTCGVHYIGSTAANRQSKLVIDGFSFHHTPTRGVVPPYPVRAGTQVGRLMGPKPVAWQWLVGFSPDDRNFELFYHDTHQSCG